MKCFGDRERIVHSVPGFESAIHEFGLPLHKWKTALGVRAFPFVEKIAAVNLRPRISTSLVGPERSGETRQHHLSCAKIDRVFQAWNPDKVFQPAQFAVGRAT